MTEQDSTVRNFPPGVILSQYFEKMFGEQQGWIYTPTKVPNAGENWTKKFFRWPDSKDAMIEYIIRESATKEVYYSPALWSEDCSKKKIERSHFLGTGFVWCEFDGKLPDQEALELVPQPTIKIRSSTRNHEHWYWRIDFWENNPDSLENLTKRLSYALGADLSGWDYTQVLRPPGTIHHESGKTTQILEENSNRISIERFADLPDVPGYVWDVEIATGDLPSALHLLLKYQIPEDEISLFEKLEQPIGKRSSALTRVAHVCAEAGMTNTEILAVLINRDNKWGKFKHRGEEGQRKQLVGIIRYVRKQHPVALEGIDDDIPWMSITELFNLQIYVEWLIKGLVQKKGVFFLNSAAGVGKTHMTLQIACHMACGKPYLIWTFEKPAKLCVIQMEIPPEELREELMKIMLQFDEEEQALIRQNLSVVPTGFAINLRLPRIRDFIARRVEENEPELIFWDSFQVAMGGQILSPEPLNEAFDFVKRKLAAEFGVANWFIHHNRKAQVGNKKPKELDDVYGGEAIAAVATSVLGMWRDPTEELIEVYSMKTRYQRGITPFKIRRKDPCGFEMVSNDWSTLDSGTNTSSGGIGNFGDIDI